MAITLQGKDFITCDTNMCQKAGLKAAFINISNWCSYIPSSKTGNLF